LVAHKASRIIESQQAGSMQPWKASRWEMFAKSFFPEEPMVKK
jgi:hypothetical protein